MKIRLLEKKLKQSGYRLIPKRGKGSHRIFTHCLTKKTLTISGNKGRDAKLYQLKLIR